MKRETHLRSLIKAVIYRLLTVLICFIATFCLTGSLALASTISLADALWRIVLYYLYERCWERARWGIEETKE